MIEIQPLGPGEHEVARQVLVEYLGMTYAEALGLPDPVPQAELPDFNQVELAEFPAAYDAFWPARDGGAVAGTVALRRHDDGAAELKRLYVREAFRRTGLGRRLVDTVVDAARTGGYRRVILDTLPSRAAARALFGACGFRPAEPFHDYPFPAVFYELRLI